MTDNKLQKKLENASVLYLTDLRKALEDGLSQRAKVLKHSNKGAVVPSKLLKYGARSHADSRT